MRVVDIAAAAGVSPSTISRFIHGSQNISPKTRQQVTETMQRLGYIPTLRKGRKIIHNRDLKALSGTIAGLAIGDFTCLDYACTTATVRNLSKALCGKNLQFLFLPVSEETVWLPAFVQSVSGVILLHGHPSANLLKNLEQRPLVSLLSPQTHRSDEVLSGHWKAGQMAGKYLVERGLRNIAAVNAMSDYPDASAEVGGLKLLARQHGGIRFYEFSTALPQEKIRSGSEMETLHTRLEPLVDRLLAETDSPAGVFIPSDWMTGLVYRILQNRGIVPGERFLFVSSGMIPGALTGLRPRPATIDIGLRAMAEQAVNMLLLRMQLRPADQLFQIAIQPNLIVGEA